MQSIYQQINQRAEAIKNDRWQHYTPLTRFQLTDYDAAADDEEEEESDTADSWETTVVGLTADFDPDKRSTRRSAIHYKQFKILKRPTETQAIRRALTCPDETPVIRLEPEPTRWCIFCKDRHPIDAFIRYPVPDVNRHSAKEFARYKRFIHEWSYICRDKALTGFHGRKWRIA